MLVFGSQCPNSDTGSVGIQRGLTYRRMNECPKFEFRGAEDGSPLSVPMRLSLELGWTFRG